MLLQSGGGSMIFPFYICSVKNASAAKKGEAAPHPDATWVPVMCTYGVLWGKQMIPILTRPL